MAGTVALAAVLAPFVLAMPASAQTSDRDHDQSIRILPRAGYEPVPIQVGSFSLTPQLDAGLTYDNNIFGTDKATDDDVIFNIDPSVTAQRQGTNLAVNARAFASLLRYAHFSGENTNSFGAEGSASYTIDSKNLAGLTLGYQRSFQRRTDPEADLNLGLPPSKIDIWTSEFNYLYKGARIGASITAGVDGYNYLPAYDADRDLIAYHGALRGLYTIRPRIDAFVEAYVNRRDFRTAVDRNGIDRDSTTYGGNLGIQVDLADRLQGEIGAGVFRLNPDSPVLKDRTGFGASGKLLWRPRTRTALTASVFRGDVATIRSGASSRTDTRLSLRVDQEARHNLLVYAEAGLRQTSYTGANRNLTQWQGGAGGEYLLTRTVSVTFGASYAKRTADLVTDRFEKFRAEAGVRLRF